MARASLSTLLVLRTSSWLGAHIEPPASVGPTRRSHCGRARALLRTAGAALLHDQRTLIVGQVIRNSPSVPAGYSTINELKNA